MFQGMTWLVTAAVAYCLFFVSNEYLNEFYFFMLAMLMRNFIIGIRYGYMSKERYALLHKTAYAKDYISQDFLVSSWMNISPETIDREVEGVFWRNEIEEEIFNITFLEKPSQDLQTKLLNKQYYETYTYNKAEETKNIKGLS